MKRIDELLGLTKCKNCGSRWAVEYAEGVGWCARCGEWFEIDRERDCVNPVGSGPDGLGSSLRLDLMLVGCVAALMAVAAVWWWLR